MRVKVFAGLLLALLIGSCPCLAPLAAARSGGPDAHACCSGPERDGPADGKAPSGGDMACCLRVPPSAAAVVSFDPQAAGEAAPPGLVARVPQKQPGPAATGVSPPGEPSSCRAASPRAPPAVA